VTDGSGELPWLGEPYPTTKTAGSGQSVTTGWNVGLPANARDRDAGNGRPLAGINSKAAGAVSQIDPPAPGTYQAYCAAGGRIDGTGSLRDLCGDDTVIESLTKDNLAVDTFDDATDTVFELGLAGLQHAADIHVRQLDVQAEDQQRPAVQRLHRPHPHRPGGHRRRPAEKEAAAP
jgi:hypothetical protein